jgi:S1-C subfamily serine protease
MGGMSRRQFFSAVALSSLFSAAIVYVLLQWPSPPRARAEFRQPSAVIFDTPLSDEERVNIRIYEELSPGVVNVTSTRLRLNFWRQMIPEQGTGSGFLIDREGHVVTNHHVIENSDQLEVTLVDETSVRAAVVGLDPINDIAVLKIDCAGDRCVPIRLAEDPELRVGQKVLAIGNPFGLERTLTTGIISSMGRSLDTQYGVLDSLIQTDAAINPGNSGGPLLNTRGEVIGVNTAILSRTGESAGIGFAVPVTTLRRILPDLIEHGRVLRAWIGIQSGRPLTRRLARALELPVEEGILIERVARGGSADLAGIRGGDRRVFVGNVPLILGGDILISMDGQPVRRLRDILRIGEDKRPGDRMEFVFQRGPESIARTVELVGEDGTRRFRF